MRRSVLQDPWVEQQPPSERMDWLMRCAPDSPGWCSAGSSDGIEFLSATFRIEDPALPTFVGPPTGRIVSGARDASGMETVGLEATDNGSGVYRAVLEIDGGVAAERTFDQDSATCRAPFHTVVPCAPRVASALDVDTTRFVDGGHEALLSVYDATGVNRAVYGPVFFETLNRSAVSYCDTSQHKRIRFATPQRSQRFGHRFRVIGHIDEAPGWEALLLDGQRKVTVVARTTVSAKGRVAIRVPAGPSRNLRLAVRPQGAKTKYVCGRVRKVPVRAGLTLQVNPRRVTNGGSVTIRGRASRQVKFTTIHRDPSARRREPTLGDGARRSNESTWPLSDALPIPQHVLDSRLCISKPGPRGEGISVRHNEIRAEARPGWRRLINAPCSSGPYE